MMSITNGTLERILLLNQLNRIYVRITDRSDVKSFIDQALQRLNIRYEITDSELAGIPRTGPLAVVANHPFGGVEGLILGSILLGVRDDIKIMANYLLGRIPELRQILLCVDPFEREDSAVRNLKPLKDGIQWLREGNALCIFPAGAVSRLNINERRITDPKWYDTAARLVHKTRVPVLPVFFDGANSALFQFAGLVHSALRTALLPHELLNKKDKVIKVRVGKVTPFSKIESFGDPGRITEYMRARTYALKHRGHTSDEAKPKANHEKQGNSPAQAVLLGPEPEGMAQEINCLPREQVLLKSGDYTVFQAEADQIPNVLLEIGRLREITFREAHEGTGQALDLDRFDRHYTHLFLWNADKREDVGAYRLGRVDTIRKRFGKSGLYTSTLFDFDERFIERIDNGIELGRSFVRPEYQKLYSPLLLLWKGIAHFVAANPAYTTLFGSVSISDAYSALSRQLMVGYLSANHYETELSRLVRPLFPAGNLKSGSVPLDCASLLSANIEELSSLVSDIEVDGKGVPVLLKQYVKMGGRLMGFNRDPSFSNVLDGLIIVDLLRCDRRILGRFMGDQAAAGYLACHRYDPNERLAS